MNEIYQKIDRWVDDHREEIIRDICRIVSIRSVSTPGEGGYPYGTGCKKVLDEMLKMGEEYGFKSHNYENYVGALWLEEPEDRETIGFWGHLDVVPEGSDWTMTEPYSPVVKDGWLIGRGAGDNKGPTVGTMHLMRCFKELGIRPGHALKLFLGCDEERGMSDLVYYREHYPCPEMSIIADSGFPVCYGEKGIIDCAVETPVFESGILLDLNGGIASNVVPDRAYAVLKKTGAVSAWAASLPEEFKVEEEEDSLTVRAFGISRHSASPEGGINAIGKLTRILSESGLFEGGEAEGLAFFTAVNDDTCGTALGIVCEDDISGHLTCVGSTVRFENGKARLGINIRYPVLADSAVLIASIEEKTAAAGCGFTLGDDNKPNYYDKNRPAVKILTDVYNAYTGLEKEPYVMGGGTYARKLPNAFAYGPGGIPTEPAPEGFFLPGHGGAHSPDEGLNLESFFGSVKLYARAVLALDGVKLAE